MKVSLLNLFLCLMFSQVGLAGHWGVGNGGDTLRIGFADARKHASEILSRLSTTAINTIDEQEVRDWLLANKQKLAADILATEHIWYLEEYPTCAWTTMPDADEPIPTAKPLELSYPVCRDQITSFYDATQLLIHESVHHFGEGETMADKVALAVVDAWKEGRIEWIPTSVDNAPSARTMHSAIWTGEKMVIFGGQETSTQTALADGGIFDLDTNTWTPVSFPGVSGRYFHDAHWTGSSMIVWGGYRSVENQSTGWQYDGFIWNPVDNSIKTISNPGWTVPSSISNAMYPRQRSVWTGDKLIVWGSYDDATGAPLGGIYDPATDSWAPMNTTADQAPIRIAGHSLSWTGDRLVLWGGVTKSGSVSNEGAVYSLESNTWTMIPVTATTPAARTGHQATWTGQAIIVFSGRGATIADITSSGGILNLEDLTWSQIGTEMIIERLGHTTTWNGYENLVYGGKSSRLRSFFGEVYSFDPISHRWAGSNSRFTPSSRWYHSAVWTGSSLIVWGGNNGAADLNDGGIYYP